MTSGLARSSTRRKIATFGRRDVRMQCAYVDAGSPACFHTYFEGGIDMQNTSGHQYLPTILYKFTERRFAEEMLLGRSIRVGTIYEFRNQEEHELQKGDPHEGTTFIGEGPFTIGSATTPGLYRFLKRRGLNIENSSIGPTFGQPAIEIGGPDGNIVCLSLATDEETRKSLDPKYDACVEIGSPATFINNLSCAVYRRLGPMTCGGRAVDYRSRTASHMDEHFPDGWCTKETAFAVQREFRLLFDHKVRPIQPFIIGFDPAGCSMRLI